MIFIKLEIARARPTVSGEKCEAASRAIQNGDSKNWFTTASTPSAARADTEKIRAFVREARLIAVEVSGGFCLHRLTVTIQSSLTLADQHLQFSCRWLALLANRWSCSTIGNCLRSATFQMRAAEEVNVNSWPIACKKGKNIQLAN